MSDVFSGIGPLQAALDYHLERHSVLSSNVAHVDTPGYRPADLARIDTEPFAAVLDVSMNRTNSAHLQGPAPNQGLSHGKLFRDVSAGAGNDENFVSLDREAAKVAANQLRYDTVSAIVSAELRQLHYAASDGKG
ncbi:MAG TPA: flagellar basal body rod protein FlgB [Polyangiaceae bacterium]|nr:flagellar basal body rod protein FlgB [Polyangiaceae bacterium]